MIARVRAGRLSCRFGVCRNAFLLSLTLCHASVQGGAGRSTGIALPSLTGERRGCPEVEGVP